MEKTFVLDTSVLLQDPESIFSFDDNIVVIPGVVIEELDSKKRNQDGIGRNARQVTRYLDALRMQGSLTDGIHLENGGLVRVELNHKNMDILKSMFFEINNDNRILAVALNLQNDESYSSRIVLVSMDAIVRIKADVLGIETEPYKNEKVVDHDKIYKGYQEVDVPDEVITAFYKESCTSLDEVNSIIKKYNKDLKEYTKEDTYKLEEITARSNEAFIFKSCTTSSSAIAVYNTLHNKFREIVDLKPWGIIARNAQQRIAIDLLLNDTISLVTIMGKAGTGKTLLSIACALEQTIELKCYSKILVAKPVIPVGKDIGFLPGDQNEKMRPWMQPIYDNLEFLFQATPDSFQHLFDRSLIQVEPLTYIRGRSIPEQFIIIDEAQNLSKHEVKTILTRAGEGSKVVLIGDPDQIDSPYLDATNNGLVYVSEKFKDSLLAGHVVLEKGERSELASAASKIL